MNHRDDGGVILLSAYSTEPPWSKVLHRVLYVLRYGLISILGVLAFGIEPHGALDVIGWVLIITGLTAVVGVVTDHYRFEWVALAPMITSLLLSVYFIFGTSSLESVLLVSILAIGLSVRFLYLTNLAARLRETT
jgi:hypothetical protein